MKIVAVDKEKAMKALYWLNWIDSTHLGTESMFGEKLVYNTETGELEKGRGYEYQIGNLLTEGIFRIEN